MLFRIYHREDVVYASRTMSKCLIPWILEKSRADAVNFIEHLRVANVDFIWSNSYDWAVLLVECINVEDPSSEDDVLLENQMCKKLSVMCHQVPELSILQKIGKSHR